MDDRPADERRSSPPPSGKEAYRPPALVQWGTLRDITQSTGNSGSSDGGPGMGAMSRTR